MSFIGVAVGAATVVGGVTTYLAAGEQADAARDAANIQARSAQNATELQQAIYERGLADLAPYRASGLVGLEGLTRTAQQGNPPYAPDQTLPGAPALQQFTGNIDLFRDPSYQFRLQEGRRAVEQSAAAKGQLQGGNTLRALTRFGQDLASQEYASAYQRSLQQNTQANLTAQQGFQNALGLNQAAYGRQADVYNTNTGNIDRQITRYGTLATIGQGAATGTANLGAQFGARAGENILGAGNAQAAGQIAVGNAYSGAISGIGSTINQGVGQLYGLGQLGGFGGGQQPPSPYGQLSGGGYNLTPRGGYP